MKIAEVELAAGGLGFDANFESFGGEAAGGEVLGNLLTDASAERGEEELGGGHALVGGSVFGGLVEQDAMVARLHGEASATVVL